MHPGETNAFGHHEAPVAHDVPRHNCLRGDACEVEGAESRPRSERVFCCRDSSGAS